MTGDLIHHYTASTYTGSEGDGFDVIETDEISIWHRSIQVDFGFANVVEAEAEADELAKRFDFAADPEGKEWLRQQFEHEWCAECGRDHRHHTAIPFMGNWFARCDLPAVEDEENGGIVCDPEGYED